MYAILTNGPLKIDLSGSNRRAALRPFFPILILPSLFRKCRISRDRRPPRTGGRAVKVAPPEIFPVIAAWATRPINRTAAAATDPQTRRRTMTRNGRISQSDRRTSQYHSRSRRRRHHYYWLDLTATSSVAGLGTFGIRAHASPKERNAPPTSLSLSFSPSFLSPCHRQFDAIVGFVSAACSIPIAPQRSRIGRTRTRTDAFCSLLFSSLSCPCTLRCGTNYVPFQVFTRSPCSLTHSHVHHPAVHLSIYPFFISIIFFLIFVPKFLVVSRWFNAIAATAAPPVTRNGVGLSCGDGQRGARAESVPLWSRSFPWIRSCEIATRGDISIFRSAHFMAYGDGRS